MSDPRLPIPPNDSFLKALVFQLTNVLRDISNKIELISGGYLTGTKNAYTAAPTTGTYGRGDFVRKSNPVEAGGAGSKYIIIGWVCTTGGAPGTWRECRVLTGN